MLSFDEMGRQFGITLYSDLHGRIFCESWNASTKHCDSCYDFELFKESPCMYVEENIYCWILEIASRQVFFPHAVHYVEFAQQMLQSVQKVAKQS